jgi:hypothetical protein
MEAVRHLLDREHVDVGGQLVVERVAQGVGSERRRDLEMGDLQEGMDAGVRAARAVELEVAAAADGLDRLLELALDRARVLLDLPAAVARAGVFERKLEPQAVSP